MPAMTKWTVTVELWETPTHKVGELYASDCRTTQGALTELDRLKERMSAPTLRMPHAFLKIKARDRRGRTFTAAGLRAMLAGPSARSI